MTADHPTINATDKPEGGDLEQAAKGAVDALRRQMDHGTSRSTAEGA